MLKHRIRRIEAQLHRRTAARPLQVAPPAPRPQTAIAKSVEQPIESHEDWLEAFDSWGRQGEFANEPDFPVALEFFRNALASAAAQVDPPFNPPEEFLPELKTMPETRLVNWRRPSLFPEVHEAWWWLMGMLLRLLDGVPPVSEAEFQELAAWFEANALDLKKRHADEIANVRWDLELGPRAFRAGEVAEKLRGLRAGTGSAG